VIAIFPAFTAVAPRWAKKSVRRSLGCDALGIASPTLPPSVSVDERDVYDLVLDDFFWDAKAEPLLDEFCCVSSHKLTNVVGSDS